jgi:hypothetical protein
LPPGQGGLWPKGGPSPNPNGRPTTRKALEKLGLTASELTAEAWERLIQWGRGTDVATAKWATQQILDRIQGKPKEAAVIEDDDSPPDEADGLDLSDLSDEELQVLLKIGVRVPPSGN